MLFALLGLILVPLLMTALYISVLGFAAYVAFRVVAAIALYCARRRVVPVTARPLPPQQLEAQRDADFLASVGVAWDSTASDERSLMRVAQTKRTKRQ